MHKTKFTEEQTELLALLPQGLPQMTDKAKLVLANIILWYGTDFAKTNGYVFRSRDEMKKDTGISSDTTIARIHRQLTQLGLVTIKSGSFKTKKANEYRLSDEMLEKIGFNQSVLMGTPMGTLSESMGTPMGTLSSDMGTLCENEVIKQLVEQNKSLMLMVNELSKQVKHLSEQVESITKNSKCTTDIDTDIEKEKNTCNYSTSTRTHDETMSCQVQVEESISVETVKASAHKDSSSLIEEEMASAPEHISADEAELISIVVNDSVGYEDALVTSTDEETIPEDDLISVDGSKGDLTETERFTYPQFGDKNPPQVPLVPPLTEDFNQHVRSAIRNGVYQWSLTLTEIPDYITGDDYTQIVGDALRTQPDYENHLGNISFMELGAFAKELMENRLKNKDVPQIVRENQYRIRHEAFRKELMSA